MIRISQKTYAIIFQKPYATVKVQFLPPQERHGKVNKEKVAFNIINASCGDIDVQGVWLLSSYNRQIFSKTLDAQIPFRVVEDGRVTFVVPVAELKAALNRSVDDTITEALVYDKNGHKHAGRVDPAVQEELAR